MNTINTIDTIKPKGTFEDSLDKLDLQGVLIMLTILSERALYLQSKDVLDKKKILKPELLKVV